MTATLPDSVEIPAAEVIVLVRCVDYGEWGMIPADPRRCPLYDGISGHSCESSSGGSLCGYLRDAKTIREGHYLVQCDAYGELARQQADSRWRKVQS